MNLLLIFALFFLLLSLVSGFLKARLIKSNFESNSEINSNQISEIEDQASQNFEDIDSTERELKYSKLYSIIISSIFFFNFITDLVDNFLFDLILISIYFCIIIILNSAARAIGERYYSKHKNIKIFDGLINILCFPFKLFTRILIKTENFILGPEAENATRDELNAMVEIAHEEGSIDQDEYRILKNIMRFDNVQVGDVMTPRTVVFSAEANLTVGELLNSPEIHLYSRFPVWVGSLDTNIIGYVITKDLLFAALNNETSKKLRNLAREILYIPENAALDIALETMLQKRQQILIVVDEYGGVEGLITMEDVIETILGTEILDEADKIADLRQLAKQHRDKRISTQFPEL